ncbi:MAG: hypothetical protein ABL999_14655 [Pyrinomonadaceae bacterium]
MNKPLMMFILLVASAIAASGQSGTISGKLAYPSDGIPRDMILCVKATNLYAEPVYCSDNKATAPRNAKVSFKLNLRTATYKIDLPAGTYLLYAMTGEMRGHKAYYNEFVKCGMSVDCHSKKAIPVKVKAGQKVKGITVGDFWE